MRITLMAPKAKTPVDYKLFLTQTTKNSALDIFEAVNEEIHSNSLYFEHLESS